MDIIINNVCGSWSPPLSSKATDALRLTCTKRKGHGGTHATTIDWDEEVDQLALDLGTGEIEE